MRNKILKNADKAATGYGYADFSDVPNKLKQRVWNEAVKKTQKKSFIRRLFRV